LRFIQEFERRVAASARADGFDGHICGHIHYARMRDDAGVLYLNDGDWVEHCTTLVEHGDGALELMHWTERRLTLARCDAERHAHAVKLPVAA
jgi:UDP-2,3-diacylglucosamine pyrophosphatase LpxH